MNGISVFMSGIYIIDSVMSSIIKLSFYWLTFIYIACIFEIEIMSEIIKRVIK